MPKKTLQFFNQPNVSSLIIQPTMNKTTALLATLAATTATTGALIAAGPAPAAPAQKPNIIFILTDDLGYGDVGAFFQNARRAANPALPTHATPNFDRLAAAGMKLTHHYCPAPVSAPSRASFLTGLDQGHANVRDNQFDKALADNHTVATVLREAGYATAIIGKWGLHGDDTDPNRNADKSKSASAPAQPKAGKGKSKQAQAQSKNKGAAKNKAPAPEVDRSKERTTFTDWPAHPLRRGFDYYYGFLRHVDGHEHYPKEQIYFAEKAKLRGPIHIWDNRADVTDALDKCYTTDLFTARAKKWIVDHKTTAPGKPFFLFLSYGTPHAVLELPTQAYPAGGGLKGGLQWLGTPHRMINTASGTPDSYIHPDYASATYKRNGVATPWPDVYKRHATSVRRIDDCVGDLMQLLKDLNIDDNTIVIFTSDNGATNESYLAEQYSPEFFAAYAGFDGIKRDLWEGGLRVPVIVRWPGRVPAGAESAAPSANWDWLPTFADLAGLPAPANTSGVSLLPCLAGKTTPAAPAASSAREYLYFEYYNNGNTPKYPDFEPSRRGRLRGQMQAIRQGDLMAVRYDIQNAQDDFEIYNVATDPKETRNLAATLGADAQARLKALALQSRRPDADAPRPYDDDLVPAVGAGAQQTVAQTAKSADEARRASPNPKSKIQNPKSPGLAWSYYEGNFPWVPDCSMLRADKTGVTTGGPSIDHIISSIPQNTKGQGGAIVYKGYLRVPADGEYVFEATTDTGLVMRLHGMVVIDADFGYKPGEVRAATVRLQAGLHPFTLTYRVDNRNWKPAPALNLTWRAPGMTAQQPIAPASFAR